MKARKKKAIVAAVRKVRRSKRPYCPKCDGWLDFQREMAGHGAVVRCVNCGLHFWRIPRGRTDR